MRRLWLADVHANLPAFEAVLADAGPVDEVLFLGDIVGYGPNPRECIDAVMKCSVCLLGNHDQGALFDPEGFNIGWNQGRCAGAGVADHIHLHIVPRWVGDSNLVGVIGETRTLPEDLRTTWKKLKLHFDERRENSGP